MSVTYENSSILILLRSRLRMFPTGNRIGIQNVELCANMRAEIDENII